MTINLKGQSGAEYIFRTYELGQSFKPLGSLYCITACNAQGRHRVLYVGQTKDLSERFADHHKEDAWKRQGATHISVHLDSNLTSRLRSEADLISFYNPCCNG
jgi:hypothetical protein